MVVVLKKIIRNIKKIPIQLSYIHRSKSNKVKDNSAELFQLYGDKGNQLGLQITPVYLGKNGIITVISDDGDFYTAKQFDILSQKYSVPVTVSGAVFKIYPHIKEWKRLLQNKYIELINHSYNHYRMDDDWKYSKNKMRLVHELNHSQLFFEKYFGLKGYLFVCPHNIICEMGLKILKERGVVAMRGYNPQYNNLEISEGYGHGEWLNLNSFCIMDEPCHNQTRSEMRMEWLMGASNQKWLIEQWHNIDIPGFQTISFEEAEEHIKQISNYSKEKDIWVAKFSDAVKYIKEKQDGIVLSWVEGMLLKICIVFNNKYDFESLHPVSIVLPKTVCIGGLSHNYIDFTIENKREIIINILPNKLYTLRMEFYEEDIC